MVVDHVNVTVKNGEMPEEEILNYIRYIHEHHQGKILKNLELALDGDDVEMRYEFAPQKFERIRRITGYLVGTVDRWNDAKRREESDRVKHS